MNIENLKTPSTEEARERGKKGGLASGKARAEKKRLKEAVESVLSASYKNKDGENLSGYELTAIALFDKARSGDVSAFNSIRDLIGEKHTEKLETTIKSTENQKLASEYLEALKHGQIKSKKKTD